MSERIECPCCGDDAWIGEAGDDVTDGQALLCGCVGHISCDTESDPYVSGTGDCDCAAMTALSRGEKAGQP